MQVLIDHLTDNEPKKKKWLAPKHSFDRSHSLDVEADCLGIIIQMSRELSK